jgi:hypothetical protein
MYYPVETRITPVTSIRRERVLPVPGRVLVGPGEVVGPSDVVARCQLPGKVLVVDVSRTLRVRREQAAKYIRKAVGESVQANEVLAAPKGFLRQLRRSCRAPGDGQIVGIRNGLILIEAEPVAHELRAHIRGQVANVLPNRGVVISTVGALVQGVWGSGGEAEGVLKLVVDSPQKPLRPRSIDVSCHGTIVVGGWILDEKALEQAVEANVQGIIVGGVRSELCDWLEDLPFPVMITEGFGTLSMAEHVFSVLRSNAGREAMLSADTRTRWDIRRPEVVIPQRSEKEPSSEDLSPQPLKVGMQVRLLRAPYLGAVGNVTDLSTLPQVVESGARLPIAEVELEDEGPVQVPLANLELIR